MRALSRKLSDRAGYQLVRQRNKIRLFLPAGGSRFVGLIDGNILYTSRDLDRHAMRSLHDIGFNYQLMKRGRFEAVRVRLADGSFLEISRREILEKGECRHFKDQGFELQIFVRLSDFHPLQPAPQGQEVIQ